MLFNSFGYIAFLPIVFIIYWIIPCKYRWLILLLSSYFFYASWDVRYVSLLLIITVASYLAGILLEKADTARARKTVLIMSSLCCFGILFAFKYFNFICKTVADALSVFCGPVHFISLQILLPVGISFYTFQAISYVIDVYNKKVKAEHHIGHYAVFVSFFPQLVAGPIERTDKLLPQIKEARAFSYEQATYGLKLIAWGYFKKIVIADNLANYASPVFLSPRRYAGFSLVLASIFFAIQIYCDFSGYSDIAIGTAKLLGIELSTNFRSPYFSQSIKEFWNRWHISLSSWFKDYVYIPLGGNKISKKRTVLNVLATFLLSGLWHGANWTFVVWGGLHGIAQAVEGLSPLSKCGRKKGIGGALRVAWVFAFTTICWVFFAASSLADAGYIVSHFFEGISSPARYIIDGLSNIEISYFELIKDSVLILILGIFDRFSLKKDVIKAIGRQNVLIRWTVYVSLLLILVFLSRKGVATEFVYFQF